MRATVTVCLAAILCGCESDNAYPRDASDAALFGPAAMRIHPIFTQVSDWTDDGRLDGVEALVELQDQFGDPTKASGRVMFELYEYRPYNPDPRGDRLAFWTAQLTTVADQSDRWNRTSRTYSFTLAYDQIRADKTYVLGATFELTGGGRFFDRIILEPRERSFAQPATRPASDDAR
jgi:hypothetical protein